MNAITYKFTPGTKMSDLIAADYRLLLLLSRLGFSLGFGEMTVDAICKKYNFDTACFLFIANLQANKPIFPYVEEFKKLSLETMLNYLQKSHSYFLDRRLPLLRKELKEVISDLDENVQTVILRFFDDYSNEVREHMEYENDTAFPYIRSLLGLTAERKYTITDYEDNHTDIHGKMSDLTLILAKYVTRNPETMTMTNMLIDLHIFQEELDSHTFIEDGLLVPAVRNLEKMK